MAPHSDVAAATARCCLGVPGDCRPVRIAVPRPASGVRLWHPVRALRVQAAPWPAVPNLWNDHRGTCLCQGPDRPGLLCPARSRAPVLVPGSGGGSGPGPGDSGKVPPVLRAGRGPGEDHARPDRRRAGCGGRVGRDVHPRNEGMIRTIPVRAWSTTVGRGSTP